MPTRRLLQPRDLGCAPRRAARTARQRLGTGACRGSAPRQWKLSHKRWRHARAGLLWPTLAGTVRRVHRRGGNSARRLFAAKAMSKEVPYQ